MERCSGRLEAAHRASAKAVAATRLTLATCAATRWGGRSILLVDDDAMTRVATAALLVAAGYTVAEACNGLAALRRLQQGAEPSAIILDCEMPVMSGLDFRAQQGRDAKIACIPVVVCSGSEKPRDASARGLDVWLRKPVDPPELLATLRRYVGPPARTDR